MHENLFKDNTLQPFHPQAHTQPFLSSAQQYSSLGLSVIPCLGDSGKVACVKWKPYQSKSANYKTIVDWQQKFPESNIGLITGEVSGLTVVDIDTAKPNIIRQMIEHFGDTPIKVKTPSGGVHLYYRYNGEHCMTGVEGLPVDIRANGGYVIAPPSVHPVSKSAYLFLEGNIQKIHKLDAIAAGALPKPTIQKEPNLLSGDVAYEGQRNYALFKALLLRVQECSTFEELEDSAYLLNETFLDPPLVAEEAEKIIENVWRIKIENRLYGGGERFITVISSELDRLKENPHAFWLLMHLKNCHENNRKEFAIAVEPMAKAIGWSSQDLIEARDYLLEKECLNLKYRGGNGPGDKNLYTFCLQK